MATLSRGGRQLTSPDIFGQQTQIAAQTAQANQQREAERGKLMFDFLKQQANDAGYSMSQMANLNPELFKDAFKALKGGIDFTGEADMMLQATQQGPVTADQFKAWEEDKFTKESLRGLMSSDLQVVDGKLVDTRQTSPGGPTIGSQAEAEQFAQQRQQTTERPGVKATSEAVQSAFESLEAPGNWAPVFSKLGFTQVNPETGVWDQGAQDFRQGLIDQVFSGQNKTWGTLTPAEQQQLFGAVKTGQVQAPELGATEVAPVQVTGDPDKLRGARAFAESAGADPTQKRALDTLLSRSAFGEFREGEQERIKNYLEFRTGTNMDMTAEEAQREAIDLFNQTGIVVSELPLSALDLFEAPSQTQQTTEGIPLVFDAIDTPAKEIVQEVQRNPQASKPEQRRAMNIFEAERALESVYPESISQAKLQYQKDIAQIGAVNAQAAYQQKLAMKADFEIAKLLSSLSPSDPLTKTLNEYNSLLIKTMTAPESDKSGPNLKRLSLLSQTLEAGLKERGIPSNAIDFYKEDPNFLQSIFGADATDLREIKLLFPSVATQQQGGTDVAPTAQPSGISAEDLSSRLGL